MVSIGILGKAGVPMELFPLRVAVDRFCNRVEERQTLKRNIAEKRPTVLISPRRYGKSSLAHKVVHESMPLS